MEPPQQPAPVRHGQVRHVGGMLQRRVLSVAGQHPQWPGGERIPRWNGCGRNLERPSSGDLDLPSGGDMRGDLLRRGQPRPPIAALAGNDSDSLSAAPYPSCDDHSAAFEQEANGNPFVNGMDHKLLNSIPCETRNSVRAARSPSVRLCSLPSFSERLNLSYVLMCSLFL